MAETPPQVNEKVQPSSNEYGSNSFKLSENELDHAIEILKNLISEEATK